jgi:hypothetical protein
VPLTARANIEGAVISINLREAEYRSGKACEVHGVKLVPMMAPVIYGNPVFDEPYLKALRELFPNSVESVVAGGCVVGIGASGREALGLPRMPGGEGHMAKTE